VGGMRFGVEPGFWLSGAGVSGDTSIFARTGPGMSFPPTPSRVPDSQKYIPVAFSNIVDADRLGSRLVGTTTLLLPRRSPFHSIPTSV